MKRRFDYAAFRAEFRAKCITNGLNPRTGYAMETEAIYRQDDQGRRILVRIPVLADPAPECLCDETSATWWQLPILWESAGAAHSSVEAAAIESIAAQARAARGKPEPDTLADVVREALAEDRAARSVQHALPLRELHAARGVTVEDVAGIRIEIPLKERVA